MPPTYSENSGSSMSKYENSNRFDFGVEVAHFSCLFSAFATENSGLVALVCGQKSMTYGELDEQSSQVANYLLKRKVTPGQMVGVLCERKLEYIIMMLGIVKAGAVYVPLDPAYPMDRLQYMSANSGLNLVLASSMQESKAREIGRKYLVLDDGLDVIKSFSKRAPNCNFSSSDLFYVVYTSGSTGRPKGVMIEHGSAVNLAYTHQRRCYSIACGQRRSTCLWTPFSFDVSIEHIMTLMFGHTLHIVDYDVSRDPYRMLDYIDANAITILCLSPSYMVQLFDAGFEERAKSLELTVLGGETIGENLWAKICRDGRTFYNFYGPTETTIDAMCAVISTDLPADTIGTPLDNVDVYLLDPDLNPVAPPSVGEIHIAGKGMARGYINNPELTAERFIKNPFAKSDHDSLLYRTGDLARLLPDGNLQIVGRSDNQVKIRGYRIELNEIELAVRALSGVADACVVAVPIGGQEKRIVAFFVPGGNKTLNTSVLKAQLELALPDYMIPTKFVRVEQFPLTANGKVDKAILKTWISEERTRILGSAAHRSPLEMLQSLWSGLFFEDAIDPHADFFDLGGDSFLVMRLVNTLEKEYSAGIQIEDVYRLRTANKVALLIEERLSLCEDSSSIA